MTDAPIPLIHNCLRCHQTVIKVSSVIKLD